VSNSSKKRSYEELCDNNVCNDREKHETDGDYEKHNYEDLFGDISDLLKTDISGMIIIC